MQHSSAVYNIEQFGAVGDGWANNTSAIKRAVEACSQGGAGRFMCLPVCL